jgi:hypothetical protein
MSGTITRFNIGDEVYMYGRPVTIVKRAVPPARYAASGDVWYTVTGWREGEDTHVWQGHLRTRDEAVAEKLRGPVELTW